MLHIIYDFAIHIYIFRAQRKSELNNVTLNQYLVKKVHWTQLVRLMRFEKYYKINMKGVHLFHCER